MLPGRQGISAMQDQSFANNLAARHPGGELSQPFGPESDVWKVGGKIFAIVAGPGDGISVKTDHVDTAALLIGSGRAERAPYLHASWMRVRRAVMGDDEVCERIANSYALIRASLPKKLQAALG
jgi:predicted DNA-binding protein (MmcQ/YjbR family)